MGKDGGRTGEGTAECARPLLGLMLRDLITCICSLTSPVQ